MNSKTVTAIQGGKTKIAPFRSILMSRITIDRTQASPGIRGGPGEKQADPAAEEADQGAFDEEDELEVLGCRPRRPS